MDDIPVTVSVRRVLAAGAQGVTVGIGSRTVVWFGGERHATLVEAEIEACERLLVSPHLALTPEELDAVRRRLEEIALVRAVR